MGNSSSTETEDTTQNIETLGYRVLGVQPDSPASQAGLVSFFDFLLGCNDRMLLDEEEDIDFVQVLKDSIGKELELLVFNIKSESTRLVQMTPSDSWGGHGLLGVTIRLDDYAHADERLILSSFTVSKDDFNVKYLIGEAQQQSLLYYNSLLSNEQIHHHLYTNNHNTHLRRRLNGIPRSNINTTTITTYPRTTTLNRTPANPTNTRGAATNTTLQATPSTINNKEIQNKVGNPISFKETKHPEKGPVIAVLLANREKDIEELCLVLRSLVLLKGDKDKEHLAPVLVFQEGDISDTAKQFLVRCTNRLIAFPYVNFTAFPADFDMKIEGERFEIKGRSQWGYYQMIRFWVTRIWEHPALNPFETIMRIDSDSCFNEVNEYLPNFKHDHLMYHSQYVGLEDGKKYVLGLLDFAEEYLKKVQRVPKNVLLWDFIKTTWAFHQTLPLFMTNMEVSSKSFMLRPEIKSWHRALTEQEPFGVMRKRWGDADIRFLTAAMFMGHDEVLTERASGYRHKERCLREEIEAAIKSVSGVTDA